jgi:hypothetical protein
MMDTPPKASEATKEYYRKEIDKIGRRSPTNANIPLEEQVKAIRDHEKELAELSSYARCLRDDLDHARDRIHDLERSQLVALVVSVVCVLGVIAAITLVIIQSTGGTP